jgi:hypothetical protein
MLIIGVALAATACNRNPGSQQDTTQTAQSPDSSTRVEVRGTIMTASADSLVVQSDIGDVTVKLKQPFHLYDRVPSDLSKVEEKSFIGVTTVKQADGSERATEIHVFPEELRGLGEGSRMMAPPTAGNPNRMTNGSVSESRMTNGTASESRMSNGSVASTNGGSLVVQYAGGSQNVTVPPNTPVTMLTVESRQLVPGDQVVVLATKGTDGSLTADKAISTHN